MAEFEFTKELMSMKVGEAREYPIKHRDTLASTATRLGLRYDRYYRLSSDRNTRITTVTRERVRRRKA